MGKANSDANSGHFVPINSTQRVAGDSTSVRQEARVAHTREVSAPPGYARPRSVAIHRGPSNTPTSRWACQGYDMLKTAAARGWGPFSARNPRDLAEAPRHGLGEWQLLQGRNPS